MVQIEILGKNDQNVSAVFNYAIPVGSQLTGASDQTRAILGKLLTAQEQQDVKDGKIVQVMFNGNFNPSYSISTIGAELVRLYNEGSSVQLTEYTNKYKWVGKYYDGAWH